MRHTIAKKDAKNLKKRDDKKRPQEKKRIHTINSHLALALLSRGIRHLEVSGIFELAKHLKVGSVPTEQTLLKTVHVSEQNGRDVHVCV